MNESGYWQQGKMVAKQQTSCPDHFQVLVILAKVQRFFSFVLDNIPGICNNMPAPFFKCAFGNTTSVSRWHLSFFLRPEPQCCHFIKLLLSCLNKMLTLYNTVVCRNTVHLFCRWSCWINEGQSVLIILFHFLLLRLFYCMIRKLWQVRSV